MILKCAMHKCNNSVVVLHFTDVKCIQIKVAIHICVNQSANTLQWMSDQGNE